MTIDPPAFEADFLKKILIEPKELILCQKLKISKFSIFSI